MLQTNNTFSGSAGDTEEVVVTNAEFDKQSPNPSDKPSIVKKLLFKKKAVIAAIAAVLVVGIGIFTWQLIGRSTLKSQLMKDWERLEEKDGSYCLLVLDFSENDIDYNFESDISWLNTTIATFDYEVIAPNKIKTTYGDCSQVITIKFSETGSLMTMTPAMTSADGCEIWHCVN